MKLLLPTPAAAKQPPACVTSVDSGMSRKWSHTAGGPLSLSAVFLAGLLTTPKGRNNPNVING